MSLSLHIRCLLMHTEALFMSTDLSKMEVDSACRLVHMYSIAVFLAAFLLTFVGIVVSQPIPWLPSYIYFTQMYLGFTCPLSTPGAHGKSPHCLQTLCEF